MIHSVIHVQRIHQIPFKHTLAFIATAVFLMSFFGSRLFATACPTCVVVGSGIHFHHFWYGIGMVALTDWLAIVGKRTGGLDRAYALVYGLGDACSNRELAPGVKP